MSYGEYRVVCLTGLSGSGKDFIANQMGQFHTFKKFSFATQLKIEVAEKLNMTVLQIEEAKNFKDSTVRRMLQSHGQEKRNLDQFHWAKLTAHDILTARMNGYKGDMLITDMRSIEEVAHLYLMFGRHNVILVHIFDPCLDRSDPQYEHPIEANMKYVFAQCDYTYVNLKPQPTDFGSSEFEKFTLATFKDEKPYREIVCDYRSFDIYDTRKESAA